MFCMQFLFSCVYDKLTMKSNFIPGLYNFALHDKCHEDTSDCSRCSQQANLTQSDTCPLAKV